MEGIFYKILPGLGNVVLGILMVGVGVLVASLSAIWLAIYDVGVMIKDKLAWARGIVGLADGGVTPGGPVLVGEKGPELVSLPKGSIVHSNAESKTMGGMGGNTIHVHVNGRVGASDAEIRDIANKVAREINLRMNRTGTATMGV